VAENPRKPHWQRHVKTYSWWGTIPARLERFALLIAIQTALAYNNRTQILRARVSRCLDILGQKVGTVPVSEILGGRLRDSDAFRFIHLLSFHEPEAGGGRVRTPADTAWLRLRRELGTFTASLLTRLKGGGLFAGVRVGLNVYQRACGNCVDGDVASVSIPKNCVWYHRRRSIWFGKQIRRHPEYD